MIRPPNALSLIDTHSEDGSEKALSTLFRFPPTSFAKHAGFEIFDVDNTASADGVLRQRELKQNCKSSAAGETSSVLLRDDHIVLLAIDGLLALYALFNKWRSRRRTLNELADLDERQLRDIGLTCDEALSKTPFELLGRNKSYWTVADLDDRPSDGETK
jgi:uncharacterized protein YjiS (DUF1127 family)